MLSWRLVRDGPVAAARNMALDHALALSLEPGDAVLRLYSWSRPTASFGRNEPATAAYRERLSRSAGIDAVRRPTGGRAVLHDEELTYAVAVGLGALGGVREVYRRINRGVMEGIRLLGVEAEIAEGEAVLAPDAGPCFEVPAPGEVIVAGRKIAGSAQAKIGRATLQHGSIIIRGDQSLLDGLAGREGESPSPATIEEWVGHVGAEDVADAIAASMRSVLGGVWHEAGYRRKEIEAADRLERERYGLDSWTWRR